MDKPILLDLFCGAGGAAVGYYMAGFAVIGIDKIDQPDYPFKFIRRNALHLTYADLMLCDAIHASPPCQAYSKAKGSNKRREHPDLYRQVKAMLIASGKPFVIENVMGSPIRGGLCLCGTMFGLKVKRHRLFDTSFEIERPENCQCSEERIGRDGFVTAAGNQATKLEALRAMRIMWNMSKHQAMEAIPPAYTAYIGKQLIKVVRSCF